MTDLQILQVAAAAKAVEQLGLVIVGGYKAFAALLGHTPTDDEADTIEATIKVSATRRANERNLMAGGSATVRA